MAIYDELRPLVEQWIKAESEFAWANEKFPFEFGNSFVRYIGAPDTYQDVGGAQKTYVEFREIVERGDGKWKLVEVDHSSNAAKRGDDGFWRWGLVVILESAPDKLPKHVVGFALHSLVIGDDCEVRVGLHPDRDGTFKFNREGDGPLAVYDYLAGEIKKRLGQKPWETIANQKMKIGFEPPQRA